MNAQKPKTEVKFPARTIPVARIEQWQKALRDAQELEKQIQEAQVRLIGLRAVADLRTKDLEADFDLSPKDQINEKTGEITRAK